MLTLSLASSEAKIKQGDEVTIITQGTMARLCPYPNAGHNKHIARIPKGTKLKVEGIRDLSLIHI